MSNKTPHSEHLKDDASNYTRGDYGTALNTVDVCICRVNEGQLEVLMIKRRFPPFRDHWAIPGGFVDIDKNEGLLEAAERELKEETGVTGIPLWQLGTYGGPTRDPRDRVISTVYYAAPAKSIMDNLEINPMDNEVKEYTWMALDSLAENIAFDHATILEDLRYQLIKDLHFTTIPFYFLDAEFSYKEAQSVYEAILGKKLLAPNFRRKFNAQFRLERTGNYRSTRGRRSELVRYRGKKINFF